MSRWPIVLCLLFFGASAFMNCPMLAQEPREPGPTDAEVLEQSKRLEAAPALTARLDALRWLQRHAAAKNAHLAVPALEKAIRADKEAKVRNEAVEARVSIARNRKDACPLAVVEALLDDDEAVRQTADLLAGQFKTFAAGSVEVLLRCAGSETGKGQLCLLHLARAAGKDKRVLDAIEKATQDASFSVRHNAHVARFQANDNLEQFLTYLIRLQEDPDGVLGKVDPLSEEGKREIVTRNLTRIGATVLIIEWSENRADDLAAALKKLLGSPMPLLRRGAVRLVGACATKVDPADLKKLLDLEPPPVVKPETRPQKSKAGVLFEKMKLDDVLRDLRKSDSDESVRRFADTALDRLDKLKTP
jgi:hypothetical protein